MAMREGRDDVLDLFLAAVDAAGGLGRLVRERRLAWLPSLMQAAFIVSQQEHAHRTVEDIADDLGVPRDLVESVLSAPVDTGAADLERLPGDEFEWGHTAGGIAKRAYATSAEAPQP